MDSITLQKAIGRIRQMELYFDALQKFADPDSIRETPWAGEYLRILTQYYEGGQWLQDYELDEQGLLPPDLKRGVLSQDAVFDFLEQIKHLEENSCR